ncbi:MAG TPA: DUF456 domain-containing protein [Beutenbergiaceae bacterium]|nr:DUF456 domain-containing protein [Beutenbergiaceae bacterium]
MDPTTLHILSTVLAAGLLVVAVLGTIFPILPGSLLTAATLLAWAWILGSTASWTAGGIGVVLALSGMSASLVLTGRKMRRERIPNRPILVGMAAAIVGMFVIPVAGLFLGFAAGLLGAELVRQRELGAAMRSSWEAMKSMGLGMIIEFACAALAASVFAIGALVHFFG